MNVTNGAQITSQSKVRSILYVLMDVAVSSMKVSVYRLMVDPEFYLYNYAPNDDTSQFLIVEEQQLEAAPFIDSRFEPLARGRFHISTRQLAELDRNLPKPRPRQYYIFHHAFVCSTLLARCLALSNGFFSLKEPHILRCLADIKAGNQPPYSTAGQAGWGRFVNTQLRLLAKEYSHGDRVVVKATNLANNLITDVLAFTDARLIYMHGSLSDFMISNLKKPAATRVKIRDLLLRMAAYGDLLQRFPQFRDIDAMNFLQHCALLWLVSNDHLLAQLKPDARDRVRAVHQDEFLSATRETLERASRWFGHAPTPKELERMTAPGTLDRHAKDPNQPYDRSMREAENAAVRKEHAAALDRTAEWVRPAAEQLSLEARLAELAL